MSDNGHLTKKARKYYARLIKRKLDSLGIINQANLVPSGQKRAVWVTDAEGKFVVENGKPKQKIIDVTIARNIYKNTLKTLLRSGTDAIEAFLNVESSAING